MLQKEGLDESIPNFQCDKKPESKKEYVSGVSPTALPKKPDYGNCAAN
jgi:hypothetical protein